MDTKMCLEHDSRKRFKTKIVQMFRSIRNHDKYGLSLRRESLNRGDLGLAIIFPY